MRKLFLSLLSVSSVMLFSCQKEIDPAVLPNSTGSSGNNNNTSNSYFPLTAGTWTQYKDSATGRITKMTVTNRTTVRNNRLYTVVLSTTNSVTDSMLVAVIGPDYYHTFYGYSPNTNAPFDLTFYFLNDTASVGRSWYYNAGQGNGITAYITTRIMEKGLSLTIQGKPYTNVIHTRMTLAYDLGGIVVDFADYDYYLAKGIGMVRVRGKMDQLGVFIETCSELTDYHIQ